MMAGVMAATSVTVMTAAVLSTIVSTKAGMEVNIRRRVMRKGETFVLQPLDRKLLKK